MTQVSCVHPTFSDFQRSRLSVDSAQLQRALASERFRHAACAFQLNMLQLGYAANHCYEDLMELFGQLTPRAAMDLVRLFAIDDMRTVLGCKMTWHDARDEFPGPPECLKSPDWRRLRADAHLRAIGSFGSDDPRRDRQHMAITDREDMAYISHVLPAVVESNPELFGDARFLAYVESVWGCNLCSNNRFRSDYFGDKNHLIFPSLDDTKNPAIARGRSSLLLAEYLAAARRGEFKFPGGLRERYPEIYVKDDQGSN